MTRDRVMDWIDNADRCELMNPSEGVRRYLSQDRECSGYYELSLALARPAKHIDLYGSFLRASAERDRGRRAGHAARRPRLPWSVPAGAAAGLAAAALLWLFFVFGRVPGRDQPMTSTAMAESQGALESVLEVATQFDGDVRIDDGALDYYYRLSYF
jgi:hypothetical protein